MVWTQEMTKTRSQEVREELQSLFSGEDFENKFKEWQALFNGVSIHRAENLLQAFRFEAAKAQEVKEELKRKLSDEFDRKKSRELQQNSLKYITDYTELSDRFIPLGISVRGGTNIGSVGKGGLMGKISLKAMESIEVDQKLSTYFLQVNVVKGDDIGNSTVLYEEIDKILVVIDKLKRAGACVTKFEKFEADWTSSDGLFSLSVFNGDRGEIALMIKAGGVVYFPDNLQIFDEIKFLFQQAKNYIEGHLQQVGYIRFKLLEEEQRIQRELNIKLPDVIIESTSRYIQVLAKKFVQLTYKDEYDTIEYGSFYSEIDRFIGKIIPGLNDEQLVVARKIISDMVEKYATDPTNNIIRIDPDIDPLDYERYCANEFLRSGWTINMTPKTGDQGADIIIKHNDLVAVVQCKRYSQPVGNSAVQEVIAARDYYQASIAVVVSTATFTTPARQLAAMANVVLMHHSEIETYSAKLGVESAVVPTVSTE